MNKITKIFTLTAASLILATSPVLAAGGENPSYGGVPSNCQIIYGGGEVCQKLVKFTIDKKVMGPTKGGTFVDNLSSDDAKFSAGQNVSFQIVVKNTGDTAIAKLDVVDTLPEFLTFVSGPGTYNANNRTISFTVNDLGPGKSATYTLVAKVVEDAKLPQDKSTLCVTNTVKAVEQSGSSASDSSQLCIQRNVPGTQAVPPKVYAAPPMKETPSTGPEALALAALIPSGAFGMFLRRKSVK